MQKEYIKKIVKAALTEDIGKGDITSQSLISSSIQAEADLIFKSPGIVCGLNVAKYVFQMLNKRIRFKTLVKEGTEVKAGTVVAVIQGPARSILTGERVALNFLTLLSTVSTKTRRFVNAVHPHPAKILDTRKTTPLLRQLERYAVKVGGGQNHRFDLFEMAVIKDNHRLLLGSCTLREAVEKIKNKTGKEVVLEVDHLNELTDALMSKAKVILLDNMTSSQVREAVLLRNKLNRKILLESSGGININNVNAYAKTGVDRISIGTLTSVKDPIDISLDFKI